VLSARTDAALRSLAGRVADWAEARPDVPAADIAVSLAASRSRLRCRAVVWAADRADLTDRLREVAAGRPRGDGEGTSRVGRGPARPGRIAFLLSGAEAYRRGLAHRLAERSPVFARSLDEVRANLDRLVERPIRDLLLYPGGDGDEADLPVAYAHAAVFAVEVALAALLRSCGLSPDVVIGGSVGEVTAAHLAGVFSLPDACRLVVARATGDALRETAEQITYAAPAVPVVSARTGEVVSADELCDPDHWAAPVDEGDRLADGVRRLRGLGVTGVVEVGPDDRLTAAVRKVLAEIDDRGWASGVLGRHDADPARLIPFLADAYVNGAPVDWPAVLSGSGGRRVELPTYPFQRRPYWPAERATGAPEGHPLLGGAVELADPAHRWFTGNRAGMTGATTVSGGALVDWAVAAARAVATADDGRCSLRDIAFLEPLPATEDMAVQTVVRLDPGAGRIDGYSRPQHPAGGGWTAHLRAEIGLPGGAVERIREADVAAPMTLPDGASPADVFEACWRTARERAGSGDDAWVPAGIDRLDVLGGPAGALRCHVRRRPPTEPTDLAVDLDLLSDTGETVIQLTGLRFRRGAVQ
jgi:acyl transferase domain-containing protein